MARPERQNWIFRCWSFLWSPNARWPFLVLIAAGVVIGVAASGAFAVALYLTGTDAFCSSCHQLKIVPEWRQSPHYVNAAGFVAKCADCHVPHDPLGMLKRTVEGFNETWNQILGTISTPEKLEAHRLEMARKEWARLRADNSQECRDCHQVAAMNDPSKSFLQDMHRTALANGQTCIDCHKGVAHEAPNETPTADQKS